MKTIHNKKRKQLSNALLLKVRTNAFIKKAESLSKYPLRYHIMKECPKCHNIEPEKNNCSFCLGDGIVHEEGINTYTKIKPCNNIEKGTLTLESCCGEYIMIKESGKYKECLVKGCNNLKCKYHPEGLLNVEYLITKHPELNNQQAESLLRFSKEKTIVYKGCYGDGSIMFPMWEKNVK